MTFVKYRLYKSSPMDIIAVFFFCESAINIDLFIAAGTVIWLVSLLYNTFRKQAYALAFS